MIGNPLIIEKQYNCTIEVLWNAISNPNAMKEWYFDVKGFELEVGNQFEFYAGEYLHECRIEDVFLYHKLVYTWTYPIYEGESEVTFLINPDKEFENYSQLKLIHDGIASFPQDDANFSRNSFEAGWEELLEISLREYVE
ncbi:SRPBCC family protein [Faecalibacter macacae]|uniref:SRPBCC domain-containing protein n=1 Tax=Faecalibacter macacae TaxID=1859289 RepID=A0A3L9M8I2_9FLAO|nr:SRPBCC domain-containing protein [Faecalibacter macacae]RLZ09102.1 SRPBCC domain-containing protein [Faecalibacter macacae]